MMLQGKKKCRNGFAGPAEGRKRGDAVTDGVSFPFFREDTRDGSEGSEGKSCGTEAQQAAEDTDGEKSGTGRIFLPALLLERSVIREARGGCTRVEELCVAAHVGEVCVPMGCL
jgi:hypothetical protein